MGANNTYSHAVVVIEKERGKLILEKSVVYNGNLFQALTVAAKNGTVRLHRYDTSILIQPDDAKK